MCGDDWYWEAQATSGEWQFQKTYVKLNDVGAPPFPRLCVLACHDLLPKAWPLGRSSCVGGAKRERPCAGKANGVHKVWLNGEKIYDARDVVYRTTPESLVEIFTFRNFHGGKSDKFRPDATQYAWCALDVSAPILSCRSL